MFATKLSRKMITLAAAASLGLSALLPVSATAEEMTISDANRAQIETIVREYLLKNPEVLVEAQQALETKQAAEQRDQQRAVIGAASADLFDSKHDGLVGNPKGSVTIVEFFDYNCGYCKRALSDMQSMVEADKDIRFVMKEFPILGEDSHKAHIVSQALIAIAPEKYAEFHQKLLGSSGRANEAKAIEIATGLGVDEGKLREAMKDPEIAKTFRKTYELANKLSITGTPTYVVGDEVVFGALGQEVLEAKVQNLRTCNSTQC
ncbi:disulfide bond formation protein DsbA [Zhengella mangrovi]|uniref:Disulfide bond formation protein DsbA n=1 Tax=Zhengella mangrovi TaxID=1982044 RepID=A0A2G1QRB0_9HYPH|nr:DsbA family protein [Zhengella mangrovi]PHP68077.1 disulfide bond formation protein DsbA [Zhengella mangrovi]